jgi:hypothetical protein
MPVLNRVTLSFWAKQHGIDDLPEHLSVMGLGRHDHPSVRIVGDHSGG